MICSKIVNIDRTEAGRTSKWGRILPAVQWCYQNQSKGPKRQLITSRDVAEKLMHTYIHMHARTNEQIEP